MTVKILKLVTGEQVVADVSDIKDDSGRSIGFQVSYPYTVIMRPLPAEDGEPLKFDINYIVWMSASSETTFAIPFSSVIAFGEAAPEVLKAYLKHFGEEIPNIDGE